MSRMLLRNLIIVAALLSFGTNLSAGNKDTAFINKLISRIQANPKKPGVAVTYDSVYTLSKKVGYNEGLCFFYLRKCLVYIQKISLDTGLIYVDSLSKTADKINSSFYQAMTLREKGRIHSKKQEFEKSISYYLQALKKLDLNKPSQELAYTYMAIAGDHYAIAHAQNNTQYGRKSLEYYEQCAKVAEQIGSEDLMARCYNNYGTINFHMFQDFDKALMYFEKSLAIKQKLNLVNDLPLTYSNIGNSLCMVAKKKKDNKPLFERAINNYDKAIKFYIERGDSAQLCLAYCNVAAAYEEMQDFNRSREFAEKAKYINDRHFSLDIHMTLMQLMIDASEYKGDYKTAFKLNVRLRSLKDSLQSENDRANINKLEAEYGSFKKDKEIELLTKDKRISNLELAKKESDLNKQRVLIISALIVLVALIVFSFYIYKANKEKQRINLQLAEQHKDITDSINYAKLIQQAIFPQMELKQKLFPDSFVLLMPKDVVSGDFYWFGEENNKRIIAAVDCTGHGVPGAFMSMIGNAFLNEIVHEKKITRPSQILNELRTHVIHALKQEGNTLENKDGMDIAICVFDKNMRTLEFAGANNPLWLVRGEEVTQINADKQPIGHSGKEHKEFTNHTLELEKNDLVYIFTDGYADQFGGPKGKKFKYKPLQQLLLDNKTRSMSEMETVLVNTFHTWKGNLHQVDDVCIIGIRV